MTSVLCLQVAEQSPSSTATSDESTSTRISVTGMSRGLVILENLLVKANQSIAKIPVRNLSLPARKARNMALPGSALLSDLRLRQPERLKISNDVFPFHDAIITLVFLKVNTKVFSQNNTIVLDSK